MMIAMEKNVAWTKNVFQKKIVRRTIVTRTMTVTTKNAAWMVGVILKKIVERNVLTTTIVQTVIAVRTVEDAEILTNATDQKHAHRQMTAQKITAAQFTDIVEPTPSFVMTCLLVILITIARRKENVALKQVIVD